MTRGQGLSAIVLVHFALNVAHGRAHDGAQVPLSTPAALFVYLVILAAPVAGLAIWRWRPRAGGWIVAASMCGALVFGLINHFIIQGPDHVGHVAAAWRPLFSTTAVLLVGCEAAGIAVGAWSATSRAAAQRRAGSATTLRVGSKAPAARR
jgi:hypothetical protein